MTAETAATATTGETPLSGAAPDPEAAAVEGRLEAVEMVRALRARLRRLDAEGRAKPIAGLSEPEAAGAPFVADPKGAAAS